MRILLLWQYYPPEKVGFALAVRGMAFAKYLRKAGHEVFVLAPCRSGVRSGKGDSGETVHRIVTYESIREKVPAALAVILFPVALMLLAAKVRRLHPDLLITSQPSYTLPTQGLILARLARVKFVADVQDVFLQDRVLARRSLWHGPKMRLERFMSTHADFVLVVLPKMQEELVKHYGVVADRMEVLYNGIDSDRFPHGSVEKEKTIDLLHLGSPRAYYDTLRLLDAFSQICLRRLNTRLVFTDCREDSYTAAVRLRAAQLGVLGNVQFCGQLTREELLEKMARARLGVYTLYADESSRVLVGTKVFEYFEMGLPVAHLGHPGGSVGDIVTSWDAGVVAFESEDFADMVVNLLQDEPRLHGLSINARRAAQAYDWRSTVPRTFEICFRRLGLSEDGAK